MLKSTHTFDTKNINKFMLKNKVKNLSPISKDSNPDVEMFKVDDKNEYFESKEIEIDPEAMKVKYQTHNQNPRFPQLEKDKEIMVINSIEEDVQAMSPHSQIFDFESENYSSRHEERKEEMEFSLHEYSKTRIENRTKETINDTRDDVIDIEMIKISTDPYKSGKKGNNDVKEGIKMIKKSLKKTQMTMNDLLGLLLGGSDETERKDRSNFSKDEKSKRSSSVFSCFGACTTNKALVKKEGPHNLRLKKQNSTKETVNKPLDIPKKSKDKKKDKTDKQKSKKDKKEKKSSKEKNNDQINVIEVLNKSDRIPVVKDRMKTDGSKVINLSTTYQKPCLFPNSRNKTKEIGNIFKVNCIVNIKTGD
jgi:hypothetical protein